MAARDSGSMADEAGRSSQKSLQQVVEDIGVGPAHLRVLALGGSVWLADGAELLLIGAVTQAVSVDWNLGPGSRGSLVSLVFIGVLLGNLLSGWLGDSVGRRLPIVVSYFLVAVMSLASAASQGFWVLAAFRVGVGLAFGIGQPSWGSLGTELTPTNWRMMMNGSANALFIVGELYAALLVYWSDPYMVHLNWRWLLACGALPSICLGFLSMFFLWESPSFLALAGYPDKAKTVLASMRTANGRPEVSIDFRIPTPIIGANGGFGRQLGVVFGRPLFYSTVTVCFSCFVLNFVMYGCLYSMPQVLPKVNMGVTPAMGLMVGCLWEVPGIILGIVCGMAMGRKKAMLFYLVATSFALVLFAYSASLAEKHAGAELMFQAGYFGVKAFIACGFIVVYQYASEIYPTVARTTGSAVCIAGGRVGSIICPLLFEVMQDLMGSFEVFYYMMATLCVANFVLVWHMPSAVEEKDGDSPYLQVALPLEKSMLGKETDALMAPKSGKV